MPQLRRSPVPSNSMKSQNPIAKAMSRAKHSSFYHDLSLRGKHPLRLLGTPVDIWPGSVTSGTQIVSGKMIGGGHILENPKDERNLWDGNEIWQADDLSVVWLEALHSFNWLKDLNQAVDQDSAKRRAEDLIVGWIDHHTQWGDVSWRGDIVAERITNWLIYTPLILDTDDVIYRGRVLDIMARSARHLMKISSDLPDGPDGLKIIMGLIFSGLYIPYGDEWLNEGRSLLKFALGKEILADGGIRSRNPQELLHLFMNMVVLRDSLSEMGQNIPDELTVATKRMAANLKTIIHDDGKLPVFNGVFVQNHEDIHAVLRKAGFGNAEQAKLDQCGFIKIKKEDSLIILDAGPPPDFELSRKGHAGTHSFEFSRARERVVVNCGDASFVQGSRKVNLAGMSRTTDAHSTLILNHSNSSEITEDGRIGAGVSKTNSATFEENGHILVESEHDGYMGSFGCIHKRLIYMNDGGNDVRGEDIIEVNETSMQNGQHSFDIRFHLHPNISATPGDGSKTIDLVLSNGESWIFRQRGANLALEDSIYFSNAGKVSSTKQIVLTGKTEDIATNILWSFCRT